MNWILGALAVWQAVEIWHHSRLMAPLRAITEMWTNKLGELLSCPWCLSVWVGFAVAAVILWAGPGWFGQLSLVFVYGLGLSRLANLGNDVFKSSCLTPKIKFDFGEENE
jgi:hypothetical protein